MASTPEIRGDSVRITWLLGGRRGGAKQSCTFSGGSATARLKLALAAKSLVESRGHDITRAECYKAILGEDAEASEVVPTFRMWAQQWIAERRRATDIQPAVVEQYRRCLEARAFPFLGERRLTDIDRDTMKEYVRWMTGSRKTYGSRNRLVGDRNLSPGTVARYFVVVSACLGAAVGKWIDVNPAAPLPGERRNSVGLPAAVPFEGMFLSADEVALILRHCPPDLYDLVYVASRTGLRMGELLVLTVADVVFPRAGGATVLVRKGLNNAGEIGPPKSAASRRDVPVVGEAAEILTRRVKGRRASALVFTSPLGLRWNPGSLRYRYFGRAVAAARRCAEHPPAMPPASRSGPNRRWRNDEVSTCDCRGVLRRVPRFHDLRHTHASVLISQGWHFKKIQRRLGHSRFQITMDIYGHLVDLGGDEELEGLEDFFQPERVSRRPGTPGSVPRRGRRVHVRTVLVRQSAS